MTAIVLPDIDRSTLKDLQDRMPDLRLSEIELPSMERVGKEAERIGKEAEKTIDRLLGREKNPVWPWVAAGIGLVALLGVAAAFLTWNRRNGWASQSDDYMPGAETGTDIDVAETYGETSIDESVGGSTITTETGYGSATGYGGSMGYGGTAGGTETSGFGTGQSTDDASGLTAAESSLTTTSLEGNQS